MNWCWKYRMSSWRWFKEKLPGLTVQRRRVNVPLLVEVGQGENWMRHS